MMALARTGHAWRLGDLMAGLLELPAGSEPAAELQVPDLSLDSRTLIPGALFLACQGRRRHALDFAEEAKRRGAVAILAESGAGWSADAMRDLQDRLGLPVIPVARLSSRLSEIADRFHGSPSARIEVFGITGTNGKTTVAHLLAQALSVEQRCGLIGSLGQGFPGDLHQPPGPVLDPLAVQRALEDLGSRGAQGVALEVSARTLARSSLSAVRMSHALFTNLTRDRDEAQEDMFAYGAAKRALFASSGLGWAVLNLDDPFSEDILAALTPKVSVAAYSLRSDASQPAHCDLWLRADAIETRPLGLRIRIHYCGGFGRGEVELEVGLVGLFNVANLLAVLAVLCSRGLPIERAARELSQVRGVPGRMECFGTQGTPQVVVDGAHTPDALEKALVNLRLHGYRRVITVFGCGGGRERDKRPLMGAIAERLSEQLILTDDNPRHESGEGIIDDIRAGLSDPQSVRVERQRGLAIRRAIALAGTTDAVLVAGKGQETQQDMGDLRVHFSDRAQVVEALREWREGHH
ncbi:Mur ligase family protein [Imhoffiella purpurea]|uniref:UDP-N-acetylmuramoyl-L-alanyl-D-glutamate--2,6-diaminopimelate ligase n=1 Tax=Imhoffiella purpurea TaxID=1249627 RepID=W9VES4_9GAMM|nr:UDP-N-acetylmuramoyl-L-alanyl-D-glutamate--2,6-diaminopimelate ligase [Imhoffiella purpurea]EXJ15486.1 UDP-N-acetylmuramoylalanyl-D-glutamate--2,6-diaminopimelate ligase [Imhoffiella purpurea]